MMASGENQTRERESTRTTAKKFLSDTDLKDVLKFFIVVRCRLTVK